MKDVALKSEVHFTYKKYRNLLSSLLKRSKQSHFTNYFQTKINDLQNTWKGIKNLVSMKRTSNSVPSVVNENNITLTKPEEIANTSNKHCVNISSTTQPRV